MVNATIIDKSGNIVRMVSMPTWEDVVAILDPSEAYVAGNPPSMQHRREGGAWLPKFVPPPPIEQLRAKEWQQIKAQRNAAINAPLKTQFGVIDADAAGQAGVAAALRRLQRTRGSVGFTLHTNSVVQVSLSDMLAASDAIDARTQAAFERGQALRKRIQSADAAALAQIFWP